MTEEESEEVTKDETRGREQGVNKKLYELQRKYKEVVIISH